MSDHQLTIRVNFQDSLQHPIANPMAKHFGNSDATPTQTTTHSAYTYHPVRIAIAVFAIIVLYVGLWQFGKTHIATTNPKPTSDTESINRVDFQALTESAPFLLSRANSSETASKDPLVATNKDRSVKKAMPADDPIAKMISTPEIAKPTTADVTTRSISETTALLEERIQQLREKKSTGLSKASRFSLNSDIPIQVFDKNITRVQFTTGVTNREPMDNIDSLMDRRDGLNEIYFFTEIKNLKGDEITHTWSYQGVEMSRIRIFPNSNRWRAYSKKSLDGSMEGVWQVVVTNRVGHTLAAGYFNYEIVD